MVGDKKIKNLVFMGPPGVGKGTVASIIAQEYGLVHLSTGNIFRAEIASASELGKKVSSIVESGGYVPDDITNEIVTRALENYNKSGKIVILDGYPRTLSQVEFLDSLPYFKYEVIELRASEELILKRLSGRRFCPNCKASFHIDFMPSSKGNICDKCGTPLITRKDDSPESIKNRLMVYKEQTGPLLDYYKNKVYVFEANNDPKALADLIVNSLTK
ncbi:adenylate kinase family protein [Mycoplasmopsis bovis]|uniref:adenylate kinase family protein n=1 Tax=Mycoplasmopsis bovis TaxID=28903 RepID=UPI0011509B77|nr:nucleoside monophosphate kinase [Mycoplasmopsis bovis]TQF49205.1 adenylate kinase [Mycoplasmopsis bovis]